MRVASSIMAAITKIIYTKYKPLNAGYKGKQQQKNAAGPLRYNINSVYCIQLPPVFLSQHHVISCCSRPRRQNVGAPQQKRECTARTCTPLLAVPPPPLYVERSASVARDGVKNWPTPRPPCQAPPAAHGWAKKKETHEWDIPATEDRAWTAWLILISYYTAVPHKETQSYNIYNPHPEKISINIDSTFC